VDADTISEIHFVFSEDRGSIPGQSGCGLEFLTDKVSLGQTLRSVGRVTKDARYLHVLLSTCIRAAGPGQVALQLHIGDL
jgi:hypothetical protein